MKKIFFILLIGSVSLVSCRKFLDINSDPDTPQNPDPTSVFAPMLANIPGGGGARGTGGVQFDALWIGSYIQAWHSRSNASATVAQADWDVHGHNGHTADRAAGIWRLTYFGVGKSMEYCINEGIKRGQWDVVGATLALKAYLFQLTTNYHGEIIFKDAFQEDSLFFRWDDQAVVYSGVDSLARLAITYLNRTDYEVSSLRLSRGDIVHGTAGATAEIDRWKKFANGILARNFAALSNKATYSADSVIKYANLSKASGADDFLIPFDASRNEDANIFGTFRDNLTNLRQSDYIVRLLDGRVFTGSTALPNRDPRLRHMLTVSRVADSTGSLNGGYWGVVPGTNAPAGSTVPWGDSLTANPGAANFAAFPGKYLFHNKVVMPVMTYSEMQFTKAEAALRKGDPATAYTAYLNGINGHFDFINRTSYPRGNVPLFNTTAITGPERTAYLASGNVKQSAATLRLEDIMQQKFIALWGWGWVETWTDMRRFHYIDIDPLTGRRVYSGINKMPGTSDVGAAASFNGTGIFAYRVRPRYNSEYVWNIYLPAIANASNYHTLEMWFSKP